MFNPLVTVIIPAFNSSSTIKRAVSSVLAQTYYALEVIIVDDASSDFELLKEQVEQCKDERVLVLRHMENRNGSVARNTGMRQAKGAYIALLDADDEWMPEHVQSYIDFIRVRQLTGPFILYCRCEINGVSHRYTLPKRGMKKKETVSEYLFQNDGFICTCALFFSRELYNKYPFNEKLVRHQDYDFVLRVEKANIPFYYSDHTGVEVHWNNNDIKKKGGGWKYSLDWALANRVFFSKAGFSNFILKQVGWRLMREGKRVAALRYIMKYCSLIFIRPVAWYVTMRLLIFKRLNKELGNK